ncbi:uncharacterized protein Z520_00299 [Fonsecaea multimorphosa CBS 102226]|uniref:Uncharacterized protein n=1 Tax=Fonsecaea multimorphosa CBS 102226 TaxID=1442371 RepID=A0A0D2KBX4_9EURO|nr:uncharacterized protein Z520_00299 [Fonsecaea multimorphosa CBS 102226]KIY03608.1 hypothetical protein Z520_00299 [Fonsecaea multimorphosa CBS 102226]
MLRRKPTAVTITNDDMAAIEEAYLNLTRAHYLKTGEDPDGLFTNDPTTNGTGSGKKTQAQVEADASDELKPLPGDNARGGGGGRSRDERIMGAR